LLGIPVDMLFPGLLIHKILPSNVWLEKIQKFPIIFVSKFMRKIFKKL
jgi:hypothetical protein